MNPVKDSYENGECPDCFTSIPDDVAEGESCTHCGHALFEEKPERRQVMLVGNTGVDQEAIAEAIRNADNLDLIVVDSIDDIPPRFEDLHPDMGDDLMAICKERREKKVAGKRLKPIDLDAEPIKREAAKVGRNDPCVCGSGKKSKKCCG